MSAVDEILSSIDPAQLAAALGTDEETARAAAAAAIPTLITGLQANAGSAEGEAGLRSALDQHADSLYGDAVNLDDVDTDDGRKIVAHALADDPTRLQAVSGLGGGLLAKLLPLLAPVVMSYLARKLGMGGARRPSGASGDVLGDLVGGLLGGQGGAGGLGDLLGGVLGGGQAVPAQAPAAGDNTGYGSGGVFTFPGNPPGLQIPLDEPDPAVPPTQRAPGNLGDLLGQILGR